MPSAALMEQALQEHCYYIYAVSCVAGTENIVIDAAELLPGPSACIPSRPQPPQRMMGRVGVGDIAMRLTSLLHQLVS